MRRVAVCLIFAAAALAPPAGANDSTAEMAAGGLVLRQSDDIDMLSEDLYVSAERIRVRYVFRNRGAQDVTTLVAFPLPDRDLAETRDQDAAFPGDFSTRVDGRPVEMRVERKALLGVADHSAFLSSLSLPLVPQGDAESFASAIDRLSPAQRQRLIGLGLVEAAEYDLGDGMRAYFEPLWTVKETWYWEQVFPAGRDLVVEHEYAPGTGGSVGTTLAIPDLRGEPETRAGYADFCVDRDFIAAVDRMSARGTPADPSLLTEQRIRYVLTTGGNWRSPIGEFRLVVDKGRPENIVSFCGEGVRRISSTRFELRHRNWRPDRDLAVLIVRPSPSPD